MATSGSLAEIAERLVDAAVSQGAAEAEAYTSHARGTTIRVRDGLVEAVRTLNTLGAGLRVFIERRLGYAYTSDLSAAGRGWLVGEAVDNARHNAPDEYNGLPEAQAPPVEMPWLADTDFAQYPFEQKVELARAMEAAALRVPEVSGIVDCRYGDDWQEVALANSRALRAAYRATLVYGYTEVMARRGAEVQAGLGFTWARSPRELVPETAGVEGAERATRLLGSRSMETGEMAVVFAPAVMARLLAQLARVLTGEAEQKGRSIFRERLGEVVASPLVNLVDDPFHPAGLGSRPFDAEGVTSRHTPVISQGRLVNFLHTTYTGRRAGIGSTANARRSSYRMTPEVGISNLILLPGATPLAELLARAGNGLLVTELQGAHTISSVTGRFSVGVAGRRIERGQLTHPVQGMAVSGDFHTLLQRVVAVGDDLRLHLEHQGTGAPSVLVEPLMVAGK